MVVEWLRSCYSASWRVWKDSNQLVKGRYYRVRHDAQGVPLVPCYPKPHIYGSAVWHDTNFRLEQPQLGEVIISTRAWNNGAPPIMPPDAITVGNPDCIEFGESIESGLDLNNPLRFESWPRTCGFAAAVDIWGEWADVYRCKVQSFWAQRLYELDKPDIDELKGILLATFPSSAFTYHAQDGLFPACFTLVNSDYAIAGISPTQNAEQALVEVLQTIIPPQNQGNLSTATVWWQQATRVLNFLDEDGVDPATPLLLVGHSYGGAAAEIAAAMVRWAHPRRIIRWLTFGAPRIGDQRLKDLCDLPTRGCALVNKGDLIGSIPPSLADLLPMQAILGMDLLAFARWLSPREVWILNEDGSVEPNAVPQIATADLVALLQHVFATGTLFGIPAHSIDSYMFRLIKRCPPTHFAEAQIGLAAPRGDVGLTLPVPHGNVVLADAKFAHDGLGLGVQRGAVVLEALPMTGIGLWGPPVGEMANGNVGLSAQRGQLVLTPRAALAGELVLRGGGVAGGVGLTPVPSRHGNVIFTGDIVARGAIALSAESFPPFADGDLGLASLATARGGVGLVAALDLNALGLFGPGVADGRIAFAGFGLGDSLELASPLPEGALGLRGDSPREALGALGLYGPGVASGLLGLYGPTGGGGGTFGPCSSAPASITWTASFFGNCMSGIPITLSLSAGEYTGSVSPVCGGHTLHVRLYFVAGSPFIDLTCDTTTVTNGSYTVNCSPFSCNGNFTGNLTPCDSFVFGTWAAS